MAGNEFDLAKCRNWVIATDDRKAIRLAEAEAIATITTAEIVKFWADSRNAADKAVAGVFRRIERCARFWPRRGSPLQQWRRKLSPTSAR
jgi:hypothetical protein